MFQFLSLSIHYDTRILAKLIFLIKLFHETSPQPTQNHLKRDRQSRTASRSEEEQVYKDESNYESTGGSKMWEESDEKRLYWFYNIA